MQPCRICGTFTNSRFGLCVRCLKEVKDVIKRGKKWSSKIKKAKTKKKGRR